MNDIKSFSPDIRGKRIYLREVRLTDVNENYCRWMNDPEVTRYLESRFSTNSMDSLRDNVANKLKDRNNIFLAIIRNDTDEHIGNIKLGPIDWMHGLADVGVLIGDKASWGKGYATEAIGLVVRLAFQRMNLHKLTAGYYSNNKASGKAFNNNGFVVEGVRRKHRFCEGIYVDTILLGLIKGEP